MCAALLLSLPNRHTLLPEALGHALQTPGSHSRSCQQRSRSSRPPWCAAPARRSLRRSPWRAEGAAVCPQVVSIFAAVGVLFVPVGAVCLAEALSVRLHLICERRGLHLLIPTDSAPPLRRWWRWSSGMTTRARAARRRRCARPRCSRCALPRRLIERALRAGAPGCRGARGGEALGAARQAQGEGTVCQLTLTVPARMRAPVYLYYELDNFYQNHRRRVPHCPSLRTSVLRTGTVRACAQAGGRGDCQGSRAGMSGRARTRSCGAGTPRPARSRPATRSCFRAATLRWSSSHAGWLPGRFSMTPSRRARACCRALAPGRSAAWITVMAPVWCADDTL